MINDMALMRDITIELDAATTLDKRTINASGLVIWRASSPDVSINLKFSPAETGIALRPGDGIEADKIGDVYLSWDARPGHWVILRCFGEAAQGDQTNIIRPIRIPDIDAGYLELGDYEWHGHAGKVEGDWGSAIIDPGWLMFEAPGDVVLVSLSFDINSTNVWEIRHQKAGDAVGVYDVIHKLYFASIDRAMPKTYLPYIIKKGDKINIFNDGTASGSFLLYFEYRFRSLNRKTS